MVPLEVIETNPLPLLNIPVSVSELNVIEGTATVPSGKPPTANPVTVPDPLIAIGII